MWNRTSDEHELARLRMAEAKRRTHLANERTFAAWIRTALALMALGIGIAGYFHLAGDSRGQMFVALGMSFVIGGALMAALSTYAYRAAYRQIERDQYGSSPGLTLLLGAIPIVLGLLALLLIILR